MDTSEAITLGIELMEKHGLYRLGWQFELDGAVSRFGNCSYRRKTISLSRAIVELNTLESVRDTILHEIAHVLAGADAGHGRLWQLQAIAIGAKPERCASIDTVTPPSKWTAFCPYCKRTLKRHKLSRRLRACSYCACPQSRAQGTDRIPLEWKTNQIGDH